MNLRNENLREYARERGVKLWEIADVLEISEATMTRKLRRELTESEHKKFLSVIDSLEKEHKKAV